MGLEEKEGLERYRNGYRYGRCLGHEYIGG